MSSWKYYVLPTAVAVAYLAWLLLGSPRPEAQPSKSSGPDAEGKASDEENAEDAEAEPDRDQPAAGTDGAEEEIPEAMDAMDAMDEMDEMDPGDDPPP